MSHGLRIMHKEVTCFNFLNPEFPNLVNIKPEVPEYPRRSHKTSALTRNPIWSLRGYHNDIAKQKQAILSFSFVL